MLSELWHDESALTTLEYALLLLLIATSGIVAWQLLGSSTSESVANSTEALPHPQAHPQRVPAPE